MSFCSVRLLIPVPVMVVAILCSCASSQLPAMSQPHAAMIAIDMTLKQPLGDVRSKPNTVYFAKVDGDNGLLQNKTIRANYVKDGRAYLLNAGPGTYVAVAAYYSPPMLGMRMDSITYLSKELVEKSKTTIEEGEVGFMGSFEVTQSAWSDQADEVQVHYQNLLARRESKGITVEYLNNFTSYRGLPGTSGNEENARNSFIQSARKDFTGSVWAPLVN